MTNPNAPASSAERPETQHTPLPWKASVLKSHDIEISSEESAFWIAKVATHDDGFVEGKHNADFIVAACNNYEALRTSHEACIEMLQRSECLLDATAKFIEAHPVKEYLVHYDDADCDGSCLADDCESARDWAHTALANAKALAEKMK